MDKELIISISQNIDKYEVYIADEIIRTEQLISNLYVKKFQFVLSTKITGEASIELSDDLLLFLQKRFEINKKLYVIYKMNWRKATKEEISKEFYWKLVMIFLAKYEEEKDLKLLNTVLKILSYLKERKDGGNIFPKVEKITEDYLNQLIC